MIKVRDLVPDVYYNQSRDFQLLGRTYEVIFNYLKMNLDVVGRLDTEYSDSRLLELLSLTLGFKPRHSYNSLQLRAICNSVSQILKVKGTLQSVQLVLNALLRAENITASTLIEIDVENPYQLNISITDKLSDLNLFYDLLDYILPAGMIIKVQNQNIKPITVYTQVTTDDSVSVQSHRVDEISIIPQYQANGVAQDVAEGRNDDSVIMPYIGQ